MENAEIKIERIKKGIGTQVALLEKVRDRYKENVGQVEFSQILSGQRTGPKAERIIKECRVIVGLEE